MKYDFKRLWSLFCTFFKIGGFTFGGGYAMIPLIQKEAVETHGWVTDEDILDIIDKLLRFPDKFLHVFAVIDHAFGKSDQPIDIEVLYRRHVTCSIDLGHIPDLLCSSHHLVFAEEPLHLIDRIFLFENKVCQRLYQLFIFLRA